MDFLRTPTCRTPRRTSRLARPPATLAAGLGLALALVFALALGGCFGDDDDSASTTTQGPGVSIVTPPTSAPVAPPTPTASPTTTAIAAITTSTAAPLPAGNLSYTVQSGDTLAAIADRFGVSVDAIVAASNLADPDLLFPGDVLSIPAAGSAGSGGGSAAATPAATATVEIPEGGLSYTIESGDTLAAIADRFGVSVDAIVEASGLENSDLIFPGDVLVIPAG